MFRRLTPCLALAAALASGLGAAPLSLAEVRDQVENFRLLQEERDELLAELPPSDNLLRYEAEYRVALGTPRWRHTEPAAVHQALAAARGVLLADYHAAPESQRRSAEVLRAMAAGGPVTLVLEWIDHRYQGVVDAYLAGDLDAEGLRAKVRYDENWPFAWTSYRPVLEAAREVGARVVLAEDFEAEPQPTLWQRDDRVVAALRAAASPGSRFLVVYGAYHTLGAGHLGEKLAAAGLAVDWTLTGEAPEVWFKALTRHRDPDQLHFLDLGDRRLYIRNGTPNERISGEITDLESMLGYGDDEDDELDDDEDDELDEE